MPELPDLTVYMAAVQRLAGGKTLTGIRFFNPFVLRSVEPPPSEFSGRPLRGVSRMGKRLLLEFDDSLYAVIHLMIAGRFRWVAPGAKPNKIVHVAFDFPPGTLFLTEAGSKKRASVTLVRGLEEVAKLDRRGLELFSPSLPPTGSPGLATSLGAFAERLVSENRTLKGALTDPTLFSGIGNAYSDEILHAARVSPLRLTRSLSQVEAEQLFRATVETLQVWTDRLLAEFATKFPGPGDITAFRPDFAVHGKFGQPCPRCGAKVQRIVYADRETNYCAKCQNQGCLLADRALSRLLKSDWPRRLEDLSE